MLCFPSQRLFPSSRRLSLSLLLLTGLAIQQASQAPVAFAQSEDAITKVKELNQKALAAYENLELEEARKALTEALQICAQEGMNEHPWKARTHVHLGAILVGGFQQRDVGLKQFQRALEIQPGISLTPSLRNPETQAAFEEAKTAPKTGAKPGDNTSKAEPASPAPAGATAVEPVAAGISGIYHKPVANAPVGSKVEVRARVGKDVKFRRLVLVYRPGGATGFLARDMDAEADGWFSARIPEPATQGDLVHYYIEARDEAGRPVASNASEAAPHVVSLGDKALAGLDDASLVEAEDEERPREVTTAGADRTGFVFGLSVGSGMGYVASATPEVNQADVDDKDISFSGVAPAKLGHLNLEAGYAIKPGFILSLQVRLQQVSGATTSYGFARGPDNEILEPRQVREFPPAKGALAVFGKATWLLGPPATFRPYVSAIGGAGEIRHVVDISDRRSDCGPFPNPDDLTVLPIEGCVDTVNPGPVFAGGGAGIIWQMSDSLGLTVGLNALLGLPRMALHADANLGMLLRL